MGVETSADLMFFEMVSKVFFFNLVPKVADVRRALRKILNDPVNVMSRARGGASAVSDPRGRRSV